MSKPSFEVIFRDSAKRILRGKGVELKKELPFPSSGEREPVLQSHTPREFEGRLLNPDTVNSMTPVKPHNGIVSEPGDPGLGEMLV
jgi:hypothetical protein